jgi:hypothetical protein
MFNGGLFVNVVDPSNSVGGLGSLVGVLLASLLVNCF